MDRAPADGWWYDVGMRRLGILLAAMIVLAVTAAPLQSSGALCSCPPNAADCPCQTGTCDLFRPPSPCHCPTGAVLLPSPALGFKVAKTHDQWLAPPTHRLRGIRPVPPLRPPISV